MKKKVWSENCIAETNIYPELRTEDRNFTMKISCENN